MDAYTGISAEQKEKLESCTSPKELFEYLKSDGFELDDKQLDMIAGGGDNPKWDDMIETAYTDQCPYCGSKNVVRGCGIGADAIRACKDCGRDWIPVRLKNSPKSS